MDFTITNIIRRIREKLSYGKQLSPKEEAILRGYAAPFAPSQSNTFVKSLQQIEQAERERHAREDALSGTDIVPGFNFGKHPVSAETVFRKSQIKDNIISLGKRYQYSHTSVFNEDELSYYATNYEANPGSKIFRPYHAETPNEAFLQPQIKGIRYGGPREFVTLDIETDDNNRPITISALKQVFNKTTRQFETVDNYQRFYKASKGDLYKSEEVHGLTPKKLDRLRSQQGAAYSSKYNEDEAESLKQFLGSSVIVGHNIIDFDLPHLFHTPLNNQTIDTLTVARNQWTDRKNDLDSVFKRLYGKTMEQAGLSHHDSMSDVIATAMVLQKMVGLTGDTGNALRYVMQTPGTHIAPYDSMLESQVIKGIYNEYKNKERYIDMKDLDGTEVDIHALMGDSDYRSPIGEIANKSHLGGEYNEDRKEYELPHGMNYTGPGEETVVDHDVLGAMVDFTYSLADVGKEIKTAAENTGVFAQEMSKTFSTFSYMDMRKFRLEASKIDDKKERESFIRAMGYGDNEVANIMKGTQELNELYHKRRQQNITNSEYAASEKALQKAMWLAEREGNDWDLATLQGAVGADPKTVWNTLQDVKESRKELDRMTKESEAAVKEMLNLQQAQEKFEHDKMRKIDSRERRGGLFKADREALEATTSMDEFADTLDKIDVKMAKVTNVFKALSEIPTYNFERLEKVFKDEVGGIMSAAKGLVPNSLYSPMSRLTGASMNALTENYAGLKAGVRAGTAIGGGLMGVGVALGATPVGWALMGIGGISAIGSQIYGNYQEAKITKWGEGIQNNLNALGFIQEMMLMPFRLLGSAIRTVVKGLGIFGSVLKSLSGLMFNGLSNMTAMGNPLSGMTGVEYGSYLQSTSIDFASLLGKGTTNSILEDFAKQRMSLYTLGSLDTSRLKAASMLGVFDQVYGYSMNEEDAFTTMVDKLIQLTSEQNDMQRKQTYVLANVINPNLAAIVQSANTLGFESLDQMKHPAGMWGYSDTAIDSYRSKWQRSQWEYQYAAQQKDVSKNRISSGLWNMLGRDIFNGWNKFIKSIADAFDSGNWEAVSTTVRDFWETIKKGANNVWIAIKEAFGIDQTMSFGMFVRKNLMGTLHDLGKDIIEGIRTWYPTLMGIWDSIVYGLIDTVTKAADFLSGIKIDWIEFKKQIIDGKSSNKPWLITPYDASNMWDSSQKIGYTVAGSAFGVNPDMGIGQIADTGERSFGTNSKLIKAAWDIMESLYGQDSPYLPDLKNPSNGYSAKNITRSQMLGFLSVAVPSGDQFPMWAPRINEAIENVYGQNYHITSREMFDRFIEWRQAVEGPYEKKKSLTFAYPEFYPDYDPHTSSFNKAARNIYGTYTKVRDPLVSDTLNLIESALDSHLGYSQDKVPALDINITGDETKAKYTVFADGTISGAQSNNNSAVDVVTHDGDPLFYLRNASTMVR